MHKYNRNKKNQQENVDNFHGFITHKQIDSFNVFLSLSAKFFIESGIYKISLDLQKLIENFPDKIILIYLSVNKMGIS